MGQEISATGFDEADFRNFTDQLARETAALRDHHASGRLSNQGPTIGLELEAWLIDRNSWPAPHNQSFLHRLGDPFVVPELSRFNIEVNAEPGGLARDGLRELEDHLNATWNRCVSNAHEDVDTVIAIGTLPTLRESDLSLDNMTPSNRYAALNTELVRLRENRPLRIDIDSHHEDWPHLQTEHLDCMLEAATTSFQLHLQVPPGELAGNLNASMILSAPLVALSANAPFLFGQPLWHETRIAIFEQAIEQAGDDAALHRVTFGTGYAGEDPTAIFVENLANYPALLPIAGENEAEFPCLRLHNGTIWRWNRPLVGFDADGTPHLRIEQRVMPAGPSVIDMIANAAFYYGTVFMLAERCRKPELPFEAARANFYAAAKHGMDAEFTWLGGKRLPAREVLKSLLPLAREGLEAQDVSPELVDRYLEVIEQRVATGRNGAAWQLAHFRKHGDVFRLTADYLEHQRSGMPVHEWGV
ncbi:MAG: hypothetical protein J7496_10205 [Novosphingobium sp.]|nr:hypothetical protein [Novosphingobium sp.]MBO9602865.1 hypothetical protein [Novosphingobium sp.]